MKLNEDPTILVYQVVSEYVKIIPKMFNLVSLGSK